MKMSSLNAPPQRFTQGAPRAVRPLDSSDSSMSGKVVAVSTRHLVAIGVATSLPWELAMAHASYPSLNGSRVRPSSSIHTAFGRVKSLTAASPLSRPHPLAPDPPNGTEGETNR